MKFNFLVYLLVIFLFQFSSCFMNFPKIIWVYWETDFQQAPLITRVSYEKLAIVAEQSGWKINLVTGKNIKDYITDIEEFNGVVKKGKRQTVQEKSDLLRIWLIEENGGVWIDFACVPYENFDWLTNYTSYQHMIINRIGTNVDDPDMLMLGEGSHQSPLSYYNSDGVLVTDEYFGMAIHFIAAKKNSRIMTDWKNKMKPISTMSFKEMLPQLMQRRVYLHYIDRSDVYYSGNIALQQVIQFKQFELDQNLSLFSKRVNVYEHYKIWCLHGQVGPIGLTRPHILKPLNLFFQTRQQLQTRIGKQRFYLKLAGYMRSIIANRQNRTKEYLDRTNKTFQQILRDGPNNQECFLHFIVEGSILDEFYKNSKYFSQLRVPIITVKERDELRSKCLSINPKQFLPIYDQRSIGRWVKPEREIFAKDTSLKTRLWVWWETNSLEILNAIKKYQSPLLVLVFYALSKLLFSKFLKKITNNSDTNNLQLNQSEAELDKNSERDLSSKQSPSFQLKIYTLLLIVHVSLLYMVSIQVFQCMIYQGKIPFYTPVAVMSLLIFLTNYITQRATKKYQLDRPDGSWFVSLTKINLVSRMSLIMYIGHCIMMHFHIFYAYAYRDTLLVVGMGYLMYVIFYELKRRGLADNKIHNAIVYFGGYLLPRIIVGFVVLIVYWRNPMYFTYGDHYLRLLFINNVKTLIEIFTKISVVYILIILIRTFILSFNQLPEYSESRLDNQQSQREKRQQSLIFIFATLYWVGTYYHIAKVYEVMMESPNSYDHMLYFRYFVLHFAVFEFAMRLRIPETLGIGYKIFLYIISFAYAGLYSYYGFDMIHFMFKQRFYVKVEFIVLTFILAFLAMVSEVFQNQKKKLETTKKNYQQLEENYEISMPDLKPETDSRIKY